MKKRKPLRGKLKRNIVYYWPYFSYFVMGIKDPEEKENKGKKMKKKTVAQKKIKKVMGEYKAGKLHSGSKKGPVVKSRAQAVAVAMSESRKAMKKGYW